MKYKKPEMEMIVLEAIITMTSLSEEEGGGGMSEGGNIGNIETP